MKAKYTQNLIWTTFSIFYFQVYLPVERDDVSFPDRMRNQTDKRAQKRRRRRNDDEVEYQRQHYHRHQHHHEPHQHHNHHHSRWRRTPAVWGEPAPDYSSANLSGAVTFLYALLFVDLKIVSHHRKKLCGEILHTWAKGRSRNQK